jgi:hypothetical protein
MSFNTGRRLYTVCDKIGPDDLGIIWITSENYQDESNTLFELNYLMDGIISRSCNFNQTKKVNLYMGQQFGHPYFLSHIICKDLNDLNQMDDIFKFIHPEAERKRILVLNQTDAVDEKKATHFLMKKFKGFDFQPFKAN